MKMDIGKARIPSWARKNSAHNYLYRWPILFRRYGFGERKKLVAHRLR